MKQASILPIEAIDSIEWRDYKTLFTVFYKKERTGKLFTFFENANGRKMFSFPSLGKEFACEARKYKEIDVALLESFEKAYTEVK